MDAEVGSRVKPSQPGRRWSSFRDARVLVVRGLRLRGWVWLLSMLWVVIGACGAVYLIVAFAHPGYGEGLLIPPTIEWPGEPQVMNAAAVVGEVTWFLLAFPVLIAGFVWLIALRGWRPRNWLRITGWTGSWVAGLALVGQTKNFASAGLSGASSRLVVGELAIFAAWLVLGALMTWMLAVPRARRPDVPAPADTPTGKPHEASLDVGGSTAFGAGVGQMTAPASEGRT